MYNFVWPISLPQNVQQGYSEDRGLNIIRTSMDAGPAKQRKIGASPDVLNVSFIMTDAQLATLETFVFTTINGISRFGFPHPRTHNVVEVRIVPQSNKLYSLSNVTVNTWNVGMTLEILP